MGLNWLEDLVSHLYKLRGYMVIENEDLQMPKTEYRKIRGHSDIDILAIKKGEVVHIECQSWWGPKKSDVDKELKRLQEKFKQAEEEIFKRYKFLDKKCFEFRKVFVTSGKPKKSRGDGPWDKLEDFCRKNGIKLIEINQIIKDLVRELKEKYPRPEKVGKEEGIARFLIHLIHNDFLKETKENVQENKK